MQSLNKVDDYYNHEISSKEEIDLYSELYLETKELAEKDPYFFFKNIWDTVEPGNDLQESKHIKVICEHLN